MYLRFNRLNRQKTKLRLILVLFFLASFWLLNELSSVISIENNETASANNSGRIDSGGSVPGLPAELLQEALNQGLPPGRDISQPGMSSRGITGQWISAASDFRDPRGVIAWELNWLPASESGETGPVLPAFAPLDGSSSEDGEEEYIIEEETGPPNEGEGVPPAPVEGQPLVGIYNSHNAEAYTPTYGKAKVEGENSGIYKVAQRLRDTLQNKYRVPVVQSETIHDYPDYNKAYTNSSRTVKGLIKSYPSLRMVLDIHRDALPGSNPETIVIDGKKTAKILIIVGTDRRYSHPNWRKNLELAENIARNLEAKYPGICRGVRMKDGTYNQQYHTGGLLIEIGNANDSLEEAERAADCLAEALSRCLKV
ncbi:MAG: stage II sporulation protein P [Firmicutes bacterium]|nr:stage II sporulation protein P [Bacillota bacterium]